MASKATTTFTIQAEDKTKAGISSAQSSFKEFTSSIDSITGGMASKVANLVTNPWTAAIAVIGTGVKVTKELWTAGLEAEKGALAMKQAWGTASNTISDYVRTIDRTTLATKYDLEGMANALSQYGLSAEDIKGILQTTADIATKTGISFSSVESAVIDAINGQDEALTKIMPEWEDYKKGAEDAKTGIQNLGTAIHDSTLSIQSGSIAQTLDNMSSSWQNIKDNLAQTLVMNIQASGILDTIARWLERIEENTSKQAQDRRVQSFTGSIVDQFNTSGTVDWANISKDFDNSDIPLILDYLEKHPELYSTTTESVNRIIGGYTTTPDYDTFFANLKKNNTDLWWRTNGVDVLYDYYKKNGADEFFKRRFQDLSKNNGGFQVGVISSPWYKDEIKKYTTIDEEYLSFKKYLEDRLANPSNYGKDGLYITPTTPVETPVENPVETTPKSVSASLSRVEALIKGRETIWDGNQYTEKLSIWENLINGNYDAITENDWKAIDNALNSLPASDRKIWENDLTGLRRAWELNKSSNDGGEDNSTEITPKSVSAYLSRVEALIKGRETIWDGNQYTEKLSIWENLINGNYDAITENDWKAIDNALNSLPESDRKIWENDLNGLRRSWELNKSSNDGGEDNSLEGWFLDSDGVWKNIEEYEAEQIALQKQAEKEKAERDAKILQGIQIATQSINALKSVINTWKDGYQAGDLGSTFSTIGGVVSAMSPKWGAILSLTGVGVGFVESLFGDDKDSESSLSSSNASQIAQYNGATTIHINNYFEGSYIVGKGGMEELAIIMRDELDGLSYSNR